MKRFFLVGFVLAVVILGTQFGCTYDKAESRTIDCDTVTPSFANDIEQIIFVYCSNPNYGDCHDGTGTMGQPDYTTYAGIKELVDNGKLEWRVMVIGDMPDPDTQGPKELTPGDLQLLQCWIEQGAPEN